MLFTGPSLDLRTLIAALHHSAAAPRAQLSPVPARRGCLHTALRARLPICAARAAPLALHAPQPLVMLSHSCALRCAAMSLNLQNHPFHVAASLIYHAPLIPLQGGAPLPRTRMRSA